MNDILFRRLRYMLSPQWDIYEALAPKLAGKTVLEIGCGTGFGVLQFLPYAIGVHAVDADGDAIAFCHQAWPVPGLTFEKYDIAQPTNGSGPTYDAVVMIEVLEHIADRYQAIKNACNKLNWGGTLYISARNALADLRRNELHNGEKTAGEFLAELAPFFRSVDLYDYRLGERQGENSHVTPLVAVCLR